MLHIGVVPAISLVVLLILSPGPVASSWGHSTGGMSGRDDCGSGAHDECARLAGPLLRDPNLVFPDNMADVRLVCSTWDDFVDCLKAYVDRCFSADQRAQFNRAVQSPVQSVHRMCADPAYQQDYLRHAPCIKSTVTDSRHCGGAYRQLAEQVAPHGPYVTGAPTGGEIARAGLCCAYDAFSRCVTRVTRMRCDASRHDGPAGRFAEQVLSKALGFLGEQCDNYIPNSGDCATAPDLRTTGPGDSDGSQTNALPVSYRPLQSRTTAWQPDAPAPSQQPSWPGPVPSAPRSAAAPWAPEPSDSAPSGNPPQVSPSSEQPALYSHRSPRPLNYGRSMAWTPSSVTSPNANSNGNSVVIQSSSEVPYWATASSSSGRQPWASGEPPVTETWYPMVGGLASHNQQDRPDQQGLRDTQIAGVGSRGTYHPAGGNSASTLLCMTSTGIVTIAILLVLRIA